MEAKMNEKFRNQHKPVVRVNRYLAFTVGLLSAALIAFPASADSKRKRSGTNTFVSTLQKNTSAVGDVPGHEISQQIITWRGTKSSDPNLLDRQIVDFGQADETAGTGTHRGYSSETLKDGSMSYARYEGTHKTVTKADGSWEYTCEGKYWLLPGTGKMKNQKGEGTYRCKFDANGGSTDWEEESEY
jgi:hypothetical protein